MKKLLTIVLLACALTSYGQYTRYQLWQKIDAMSTYQVGYMKSLTDSIVKSMALQSSLDLKANLASPTFTGTPAAPTAASSTNSTQIATTAFVKASSPTEYGLACSDLTTDLTTGDAKAYFRIPKAFTVTAVRASVFAAQGSGSALTIRIEENGTTILSTLITIDNGEKTSTTAAAPVISDASLADDSEITVDIVTAGTGGKGLIVWLIGY